MKKFLKWAAIVVVTLAVVGFCAFLYLIPPFTLLPPQHFIDEEKVAPPSLDNIADPAERAIAEHGKYIVTVTGCSGCHTPQGDKGPAWDKYMAGGMKLFATGRGSAVSRNLTPDAATGVGAKSNDDIARVLRSGVLNTGRLAYHHHMPWTAFANWTDEDRYAVVVYLRHLKPVTHTIPDPDPNGAPAGSNAIEGYYGLDYGR